QSFSSAKAVRKSDRIASSWFHWLLSTGYWVLFLRPIRSSDRSAREWNQLGHSGCAQPRALAQVFAPLRSHLHSLDFRRYAIGSQAQPASLRSDAESARIHGYYD